MQVTTIFGHEFTTIASLKAFAAEHGIAPTGNKTLKQTWIDAVESYLKVQSEVVAMAVDAEQSAAETSESIEVAIVSVGSLIVAALTSDEAVKVYRGILKFAVFAVIMTWMFSAAAVKWLWSHRQDAAICQWIGDLANSQHGKSLITQGLIIEWVISQWIDTAIDRRDGLVRSFRQYAANAVGRLGGLI